ncbi:hypothetical protein J4475_03735 [Candidatus Woesearchaeota archaeon]|nr:hypothetical protein [Candidatus Woesearchaeota archaeon]
MNPEKRIVTQWLNTHGFFTVSDINAGRNRVIDSIAIRRSEKGDIVWHVEVAASISQATPTKQQVEELEKRFHEPVVEKTMQRKVRELLGKDLPYQNVLVTTARGVRLKEIEIVKFDEVLVDTVKKLDRQNYGDPVTRSLQLVKFLMLSNPKTLAKMLVTDFFTLRKSRRFVRAIESLNPKKVVKKLALPKEKTLDLFFKK